MNVYEYLAFIPLGLLGLIRWTSWLVRRVPAALYRPVDNSHRLPLSIVVPTYQEDPEIFARAIESWLANGADARSAGPRPGRWPSNGPAHDDEAAAALLPADDAEGKTRQRFDGLRARLLPRSWSRGGRHRRASEAGDVGQLGHPVEEIILVIDSTDVVCQEVASRYPVTVLVTDVPGKRDALKRGWEAASTPLVALVDSDTIWASDVAAKVCMPFADPQVGGVATRQSVYNPRGFLQRVNDIYLDLRYFDENAAQTFLGGAVSCISGRTAVYRRELLLEIGDEFMDETFLGVPCMSGDDKRLTSLILARGHRTYMQRSARVWSTFPNNWRTFFKQRLRWARNTWRSDVRAVFMDRWAWRYPFLTYTMLDKMISAFTLLAAPVFMTLAIIHRNWFFVMALAIWWWVSRALKLLPHLRRRPSSFFLVPPFVLLSFVMALVKLAALLTIRKQRWLTRQVQVVDGEVVRSGGVSAATTATVATAA